MELIISSKDFNTIKNLIEHLSFRNQVKEVRLLAEELKKMKILASELLPRNLVGINSEVSVHEVISGKKMNFRITLPSFANLKEKRISIFAPISIALLGFRKGDLIEWHMPGGLKKLKITNVRNEIQDNEQ
jgi:regulator of nucleoside diphosphate kinase